MNATERLKAALAPLAERTKRRAERIKQLQAQPQTEQTVKAIAAEQREITLFMQVANDAGMLVENIVAQAHNSHLQAQTVVGRVQQVAEDASHYEHIFHKTLDLFGPALPLPDEKWPAVVLRAHNAIYRMHHIRTSPETYAATFGLSQTA